MNGLTLSGNTSLVTTPSNPNESSTPQDQVQHFDKKIQALKKKKTKTVTSLNELFNEAMAGDSRFMSRVMLKDCEKLFEGVEALVDVECGTGTMAKAVADAFPEMKCTVLDLPHVVSSLEGVGNLNYVGGTCSRKFLQLMMFY